MGLRWSDVQEIAIELADGQPDHDPRYINFVELRNLVIALEDFEDEPEHCGEKVLEAIQQAWIEEAE